MRTPLNALITEKVLATSANLGNPEILDLLLDREEDLVTKNVCAKVSPELAGRIDSVCTLLGISKRRFLEAAFIEAVEMADTIIQEEGLYQALEEQENRQGRAAA